MTPTSAVHRVMLGAAFSASLDAIVAMDSQGLVLGWNPAAERLFGVPAEQALGEPVADLIVPGPLREAHRYGLRRYLKTRDSTILGRRVELPSLRQGGVERPVELTVTVVPDTEPPVFVGFLRDLGEQERTRQENLRLARRMSFLAQIGPTLDRSLELSQTLRSLADLTVPELAQLTVIDLLGDDGLVQSAVAAAVEPGLGEAIERARRLGPLRLEGAHPVSEALRTGQPVLLPAMSHEFLEQISTSPEHLEVMLRVGYRSAIVVPLVARRRVLGALSLLRLQGALPYDSEDLVLAEEVARRAALAIENSRLFETTRNLARTLQESLLPPELPEVPGATLALRYRAAAEGQVLGGDFYDVFPASGGRAGITLGDVCGKGPEAAALTALARYTIRALADQEPREILRRLNLEVHRDQRTRGQRFLTAVVAQAATRSQGGLALEVAVGGHPPPLLLREGGSVELVQATGALVGLDPGATYSGVTVDLNPGDTLVLYTDGLTDAGAPQRVLSTDELLELLRACAGESAEMIATRLEAEALRQVHTRDDVAVMVLQAEAAQPAPESPSTERSSAGG